MQLTNDERWCVVDPKGTVITMALDGDNAGEWAADLDFPTTIVHCRLVPVADLPVWRPIAEAPRDGTWLLVHVPSDYGTEIGWWDKSFGVQGWWVNRCGYSIRPTHFMPLPAPRASHAAVRWPLDQT